MQDEKQNQKPEIIEDTLQIPKVPAVAETPSHSAGAETTEQTPEQPIEEKLDRVVETENIEQVSAPLEATVQSPTQPSIEPAQAIPQTNQPSQQPQTQPQPPQPQIIEKVVYKTDPNIIQKLLIKARAKIQERKRAKLDKIMSLFITQQEITNKDVQKLLHARKRTVRRYLDQLEREQKITQVGSVGRGVKYVKKQ